MRKRVPAKNRDFLASSMIETGIPQEMRHVCFAYPRTRPMNQLEMPPSLGWKWGGMRAQFQRNREFGTRRKAGASPVAASRTWKDVKGA